MCSVGGTSLNAAAPLFRGASACTRDSRRRLRPLGPAVVPSRSGASTVTVCTGTHMRSAISLAA
jgi:hypothetical protein